MEQLAGDIVGPAEFIFTGWQTKVFDFLVAADLFVFPSRHEGCPNALLEALSLDLPCWGSNIPEIRAVLRSKDLLFDPEDFVALSHKLNQVMCDLDELARMKNLSGKAKQSCIFDWDEMLVQLHTELLP